MIPICVPNLAGNEEAYLRECISTGFVSSVGAFVEKFETMTAEATGAVRAVATSSGTAALHAALSACDVGPGDLVIMPSYSFIATANAISYTGAQPWLFDIDPDSWTLDAELVERHLQADCSWQDDRLVHTASGRHVAAIVPVFAMGHAPDMAPLVDVAKAYGLPVIADAAPAIGCLYGDRPLAHCGADLCAISFNGNKTVTSGGGGAVIGRDQTLLETIKHITTTARVGDGYDHDRIGFNYRMTNLEAAVGCAQLELLERFVDAKRTIRARYNAAFASLDDCACFPDPSWGASSCWLSGIVLRNKIIDDVAPALMAADIHARAFWKPMHQQTPYAQAPRTDMAVCDDLWQRIVVLPSSTHLDAQQQDLVIKTVLEALG